MCHTSIRSVWLYIAHLKIIINIPFCRALKTTSIYRISFHISIIKKLFFVSRTYHMKYSKNDIFDKIFHRSKFPFRIQQEENKSSKMCRISCSIFLVYGKRDLSAWQIRSLFCGILSQMLYSGDLGILRVKNEQKVLAFPLKQFDRWG